MTQKDKSAFYFSFYSDCCCHFISNKDKSPCKLGAENTVPSDRANKTTTFSLFTTEAGRCLSTIPAAQTFNLSFMLTGYNSDILTLIISECFPGRGFSLSAK